MNIEYHKDFKKELKKLRKYPESQIILAKIINHIEIVDSYKELINNPITYSYGFENLKYTLNKFYSFRLEKSGIKRLILTIDKEKNIVKLVYISLKHYIDFKKIYKNFMNEIKEGD